MSGKIKNYILDANVLMHDPNSIFAFEEHDVYILVSVLEELDKFKTNPGSVGSHARMVARSLDSLREKGSLKDGVELESGGRIFVIPFMKNGLALDLTVVDNQLLTTAHKMASVSGQKTVVVTKDINLRIRADGVGVLAEDYRKDKQKVDSYVGYSEITVPKEVLDMVHSEGEAEYNVGLPANHYVRMVSELDSAHVGLARVGFNGRTLLQLAKETPNLYGIRPKNMEQTFALDALLDEDIKVVTLRGKAGTGKTLLAIAVGLSYLMADDRRKMTITRPVIPVGRDIGFLPGDLGEKMAPWMRPIYDALDAIRESDRRGKHTQIPLTAELDGMIDVAPLSFVRGRSIANSFMIVDEAQNLTPHEVKTLMTRAGNGTKLVLTGDIDQIDNPYLDSESNGFSYLISKFKGQSIYAHVELVKGERSKVAELASNIL
jgi:PhoH-like ATPase